MALRAILASIVAFFLIGFNALAWAVDTEQEPEAEAIMVLDASGSMWGQIEGKNKIVIAREVIGKMLETWPDNVTLGLIAYGHREEGNCGDIEELVSPSRAGAGTIPGVVNSLNPKGKTPLTDAVRQAAGILKDFDAPGSIILITDGLETCNADPCALGKELAASGIDLKVHVVGFDLGAEDTTAIQCLADSTGGQYLSADNAEELTAALGQATGAVKATVANDVLQIYLSEDSDQFKGKTSGFEYFAVDANGNIPEKPVDFEYGYEGYPALTPGEYVARVKLGAVALDYPFEVKADERQVHKVNLNAGILKTAARLDEDSDTEVNTLGWEIFALDEGGTVTGRADYSYGATGLYYVPAGRYRIWAKMGSASATADVAIGAGETVEKIVDLRAGKVHFSAVLKEGGPAATGSLGWTAKVYDPATGEIGGYGDYSYGASDTYILNAGIYMLTVSRQGVTVQKPITIIAGEDITEVLNLDAGYLDVNAKFSPTSEPLAGSHGWEVYKVNDDGSRGARLSYDYGARFQKMLPAGPIEVMAKVGSINRVERLEIIAAETTTHTINLDGGQVNYSAVAPNGEALGGSLGWDIYHLNDDGSVGARASYDYGASGAFLVPAGRYRINVRGNDLGGSDTFTLKAGETITVIVKTNPQ